MRLNWANARKAATGAFLRDHVEASERRTRPQPSQAPPPRREEPEPPKSEPYYVYHVAHGKDQKFGYGNGKRVQEQARIPGARVLRVLEYPTIAEAKAAEKRLKKRYGTRTVRNDPNHQCELPRPFGVGTEVMHDHRIRVDRVCRDGVKVTDQFR